MDEIRARRRRRAEPGSDRARATRDPDRARDDRGPESEAPPRSHGVLRPRPPSLRAARQRVRSARRTAPRAHEDPRRGGRCRGSPMCHPGATRARRGAARRGTARSGRETAPSDPGRPRARVAVGVAERGQHVDRDRRRGTSRDGTTHRVAGSQRSEARAGCRTAGRRASRRAPGLRPRRSGRRRSALTASAISAGASGGSSPTSSSAGARRAHAIGLTAEIAGEEGRATPASASPAHWRRTDERRDLGRARRAWRARSP